MKNVEIQSEHQKDLERIANFRLLDDDFMTAVFQGETACTELLLRIILNNTQMKVNKVIVQDNIKNINGRSIRLDIHAYDEFCEYDIEIQRADKGADARRARYNGSIMDANALIAGDKYENLPESYVIFITENDVLKGNLPIYHVERTIRESGESFADGMHIIYVNGANTDDTPLGRLMHDFRCKDPSNMYYEKLATRVRYFKETKKGVDSMCKVMEDMRREAAAKKSLEYIIGMLKEKLPVDMIARITKISAEKINEIGRLNGLL